MQGFFKHDSEVLDRMDGRAQAQGKDQLNLKMHND